ncbi:galactoside-binding lectin domain-containing protein [Ditylenchus destructor]|uniref:Galectin n=1 Tax=Ditylenchus destructor TaxID=166010 RepID=A0AAD4NE41_9BILA|nr:galactoside-binding lectin domain-containing protein [Ditylenchus destructor]
MSAYDHFEQEPDLENTEFSSSAAKTEGGHETDYYSRTHYGFENEDHDALGAHVLSAIGENEATGVEPEIGALTPEVLDQAPEAEDKFAGAPGLDLDEMAAVNDKKHKEENASNLNETNPDDQLSEKVNEMALETQYPIPYRSKLVEQFEPGQTLIIKGKTAEDSVRFTVNLHTASADFSGNDVPLHISVRFDEGKIVCNTFTKGEWGKEERKSNPWKKGDDIDLRIRAHDSKFQIFADQKEIKEYEHRVPLSSVSHFSIDGDVFITHVHWGGKYYPVPYESGIPGEGLAPGKTLLIFGTPEKKGKRFHINLLKKNGDIALHFNPRFDEKAIVRNSLISNEWGNEEREGKIPLEKGIGFDLKIVNEEYAFQIFLNEERFCTYAHRLEPHDLHGLQIGGDVEISGIQIF